MERSDQLERQAEHARRQLAATLDELRGRLTPASLGREVLGVARRSAAARFVTNFSVDARNNAVPLAGLAASIAWIMLSKGRRPGASPPSGSYDRLRDSVVEVLATAGSVASGAIQTASAAQSAAQSLSHKAGSAAERISKSSSAAVASTRATADRMQRRFTNAAWSARQARRVVMTGASSLGRQASLTAETGYKLARHDPVFATGIGLAVVGIAASMFGWSRKPVDGHAVSNLTDAARGERRAVPKPFSIAGSEAPIIPDAPLTQTVYGGDRTGAAAEH